MPEEPIPEQQPLFSNEELYNLRVLKLSNGEELLAVILASMPEDMLVRRPCQIYRLPGIDGNIVIVLAKWQAFSNEEKHSIKQAHIISFSKITDEMKAFYIKTVIIQMQEENKILEPASVWPEWMDKPLTPNQRN